MPRALMDFARPPQRAARLCSSMLAILNNLLAVDEDMFHPNGVLMRILKGGAIGDGSGIKNNYVREHPFLKKTAMIQP